MTDSKWYFTEEQLANSPSRKCGINGELELSYRQRAANLIQEMGQRLQVSQLCINTAIVYMHRFYAFHSFTMFHRNSIAAAAFFLAAKVEEQPRKLEHVIRILNICLEKNDVTRDVYTEQAQELVFNENILLQTLGFDVAIDHPHTHVVKACQLFNIVTVSRELRQTCYFMASNSLHLTTMCLKYRPTVVAAFCIYIACKWSRWEIPDSSEGKAWYSYVDESVTLETLKKLTEEYLQILERSPSKFKSKMKAITSNGQAGLNPNLGEGGPSTSSHHKPHHHHHHRSNSNSNSSNSSNLNSGVNVPSSNGSRKQFQPNDPSATAKNQMHPMANANFKQNQSGMNALPSASTSQMHRQRPSSNQPSYSTSSNTNSNQQKSSLDDRSQQQRMPHQEYYNPNSLTAQKILEQRHRMSQNPSLQPQQPHMQPPYMKTSSSDQKHNSMLQNNSKQQQQQQQQFPMEMHQKNTKQSGTDYHNRSSNSQLQHPPQQMQNNPHKKPPWSQQMQKSNQIPISASMISDQSSSILTNSKSNFNEMRQSSEMLVTKQQAPPPLPPPSSSSMQANASQNDFWFNDKINDVPKTNSSPPRPLKSLFSPSPEQDTNEKSKYMMDTTPNLKSSKGSENNHAIISPKEERKNSTPSKREKLSSASSQKSSSSEKKLSNPVNPASDMNVLDANSKKRTFNAIRDNVDANYARDSKVRKVEHVKQESSLNSASQSSQNLQKSSSQQSQYGSQDQSQSGLITKQPIETNPDIVKSLLQECFSSSKFPTYDNDSPLDVINPEPPEELLATHSALTMNQQQVKREHNSDNGDDDNKSDKMSLSASEGKHKKKSKKKKEKHKHKKKHKHSDREDRNDLKMILSKDKHDSKSSDEGSGVFGGGGLKIKIPIKDVQGKTELNPPPGPIKLKISKEKFGSFTNLNNSSTSSSTSSHKKKDKDREKSKSKSSKQSETAY